MHRTLEIAARVLEKVRILGRTNRVMGTAGITVLFSFIGPLDSFLAKAGLWIASAWLVLRFIPILSRSLGRFQPGRYFMRINYFVLLVVVFMCLDKILLQNIEQLF